MPAQPPRLALDARLPLRAARYRIPGPFLTFLRGCHPDREVFVLPPEARVFLSDLAGDRQTAWLAPGTPLALRGEDCVDHPVAVTSSPLYEILGGQLRGAFVWVDTNNHTWLEAHLTRVAGSPQPRPAPQRKRRRRAV